MLLVILGILWLSTSFLSPTSIANEGVSDGYVYLRRTKGTHFFLEIKEFGSNATVYSEKTMLKKIGVPLDKTNPFSRHKIFSP